MLKKIETGSLPTKNPHKEKQIIYKGYHKGTPSEYWEKSIYHEAFQCYFSKSFHIPADKR